MKTCETCEYWKHWKEMDIRSDEFGQCLLHKDEDGDPIITGGIERCDSYSPNAKNEGLDAPEGERNVR